VGLYAKIAPIMNILLIKTSSLGDVIHNLPVVNDLLKHHPNASIDWVVEESFADIPKLHPHVNQVYTVAFRRWRRQLFKLRTWQEIKKAVGAISRKKYDLVIDTQGLIKSGILCALAKGTKHGYDKRSIREPLASCFYQKKHGISYQQHAVTRNRALVALSLGYDLPTDPPDYGIQAQTLNDSNASKNGLSLPSRYAVALHGTSRDSKLWPQTEWIDLGRLLTKQGFTLVLPWSNQAEFERATHIASNLSQALVLPKLSIAQLAGVIQNAKIAIGVDTGLSHLAAALNVPTVAIYTDTNPALTGVMQGAITQAINLGGIAQIPSHALVLDTTKQIVSN
jgi:heptosyltransferase I